MNKNYEAPLVEVIEIEIEEAVLSISDLSKGNGFGDSFYDEN